MNQFHHIKLARPLEFYLTGLTPCSYREGYVEQRLVTDISRKPHQHDSLACAGFRRVENWLYKPICANCNACVPLRIASGNGEEGNLTLSRSQQRILRRNNDLERNTLAKEARQEHFELFRRYLLGRHRTSQMVAMHEEEFATMMTVSPVETMLIEFKLKNKVVGVMLTDVQADGLSAVYSFFDPEMKDRSLGIYMVLSLAELAFTLNLPFVYLGYYVAQSQSMRYKANFSPAEILKNGKWIPFEK